MKCLRFKIFMLLLMGNPTYVFCSTNNIALDYVKSLEFNTSGDTLIFAHVIYRHGDRNINKIYPNDPYADESYWQGGFGQLTHAGKMRHFKLGQFFRRRYGKLLADGYSPKKVYVEASDVDRTIASALANLAGMFPPSETEIWNDELNWQPIPVHKWIMKECAKYYVEVQKYMDESSEVRRIYTEYADHFAYWSKMCGLNITTIDDVYVLYNTLVVETEHNKSLPDWAKRAIEPNGVMEYITLFDIKMYANTTKLARLHSGFILKEILQRFSQKINSTLKPDRDRLLWFQSTHYYIIANLLNSLGLFEKPHLPPYASSLIFELYKRDGEHYIQIFYKKSEEEILSPLNIPKCGTKCPLQQFYILYDEIIPGDFDSECTL
ncbi:prostatic acid phosphatase-like [Contarinia nasturtii]|uniref:prostatic acid phosphatase-like n=1 Tax=Contarinia nasturtii TaxID=265458 RepID=UPI0012D3D2A0|nr:prostatic acid phosphatase-like [Contarinia nasturtii]